MRPHLLFLAAVALAPNPPPRRNTAKRGTKPRSRARADAGPAAALVKAVRAPVPPATLARLLSAVESEAYAGRLNARGTANAAWAVAKLSGGAAAAAPAAKAALAAALAGLAVHLERNATSAALQMPEHAMASWALAVAGGEALGAEERPALWAGLGAAAAARMGEGGEACGGRELAMTAHAHATARSHSPALLAATGARLEALLAEEAEPALQARDVANLAWAAARTAEAHAAAQDGALRVLAALAPAARAAAAAEGFGSHDVSQYAAALATARYDDCGTLDALVGAACARDLARWRPRELAGTAWACARLDSGHAAFVHRAAAEALARGLHGFNAQEASNLAWSCAVVAPRREGALVAAAVRAVEAVGDASGRNLRQLHQASRACGLPPSQALQAAWEREKAREKQPSARHRAISDTLSLMKVPHDNEAEHDIDVRVRVDASAPLALEVDGPSHFCCGPESRRPLGHTVLKRRLLRRAGYRVVSVPYYEWDRIPFWASMEKQRYLQRRLALEDLEVLTWGVDSSSASPLPEGFSREDAEAQGADGEMVEGERFA